MATKTERPETTKLILLRMKVVHNNVQTKLVVTELSNKKVEALLIQDCRERVYEGDTRNSRWLPKRNEVKKGM